MKKIKYNLNIKNIYFLTLVITFLLVSIMSIMAQINEENYTATNLKIEIPSSHKNIRSGESLWFTIKVLNLANKQRMDVSLKYEILDSNKVSIITKSETVAIETQASFVKQIEIPKNSPSGKYSLYGKVTYANGNEVFAEDSFNIIEKKENKSIIYFYIIISIAIIMFFMILIIVLIKYKSIIEKIKMHMKIKNIIKKKLFKS